MAMGQKTVNSNSGITGELHNLFFLTALCVLFFGFYTRLPVLI